MKIQSTLLIYILLSFTRVIQAVEIPVIKTITVAKPKSTVYRAATKDRPLILRSEKEASVHFARPERPALFKAVDFRRQFVLVFAWRGSGKDRLSYNVLKSSPEQVVFEYRAGRSRDLRQHLQVYALRSDVSWRTRTTQGGGAPPPRVEQFVKVQLQGRLDARVVAIGGETTGVVVSAGDIKLELDFGRNATLRRKAQLLHGRNVRVAGRLVTKRGVERGRRLIVSVESLQSLAGSSGGDTGSGLNAYLTPDGKLRQTLTIVDSQTGFAGNSGHQWTVETDGKWNRRPFLNRELRPIAEKGLLTPQQLRTLANSLHNNNFFGLPDQLGKDPQVNPHRFSIKFGNERKSFVTRGGGRLPAAETLPAKSPELRFATIYQLLQRSLQGRPR